MRRLPDAPCIAHLDLLLATTPTIAFTLNDQGVFIMVEGRGLAETGLTANAFVGTSVFEMGMVYPHHSC